MRKSLLMLGGLAVAVVLLGAGCLNNQTNTNPEATGSGESMEGKMMEGGEHGAMEEKTGENMEKEGENMMMEKSGSEYAIRADSSVSYTVQKKWLNKAADTVVGTNSKVTGSIKYDSETKQLTGVFAQVDPKAFDSGNAKRDGDVNDKIFTGPIVITGTDFAGNFETGSFNTQVPLQVEINGTKKTVNFSVQGTIDDEAIGATGKATIDMQADFGIEPPSILKVYSVDESADIAFDIKADLK